MKIIKLLKRKKFHQNLYRKIQELTYNFKHNKVNPKVLVFGVLVHLIMNQYLYQNIRLMKQFIVMVISVVLSVRPHI